MGHWHTDYATECGHEVYVHEDWDGPPRFCKACKAENDANWYDVSCGGCGATVRAHRGWDRPPRFCPSCKERNDAQWTERTCRKCGSAFRVRKDWDKPPTYCNDCRSGYSPIYKSCHHCGESFEIPVGTQLTCEEKDWELPRKCKKCRELFSHKPFKTIKEEDITGGIVFRTYNSLGDFISESRKEKGFFGAQVKHTGKFGKHIGTTYVKGGILGETVTRRPDGSQKSTSYEGKDFLGDKYRSSRGGSSQTTRETRTQETWTGEKHKKTE